MTNLDYTKLKKNNIGASIFWQRVKVKRRGDVMALEIELLDYNGLPDCRISNQGFRGFKNKHSKKAMRYRTVEGMKKDVEKLLVSYGWAILGWS